jgi:uncharacterized membrane protein YkvA (DUF1232 family)
MRDESSLFKRNLSALLEAWKAHARAIKTQVYALYLAYRDPRTPWYARLFAACVAAYAFSPIDLIPDPIPILGYLDDLVLVPLGIWLALKMIPTDVMKDCQARAQAELAAGKPVNWVAGIIVIAIWIGLAALAVVLVLRLIRR